MRASTIAFFNNKGGVGKTSLVYHLAWMFDSLGVRVIAADLDPQANLTAAFLDEEEIERLWEPKRERRTIYGALEPMIRGLGDLADPHLVEVDEDLSLMAGDLKLSEFEDQLSEAWPNSLQGQEKALRVTSSFWRLIQNAAERADSQLALLDLGPNLGALNRAAMFAADWVVIPLAPDLFSLQGLRNLGPTLARWRSDWQDCTSKAKQNGIELDLPPGKMQPAGYVVLQHSIRFDRPTRAYDKWMGRIPDVYRTAVMRLAAEPGITVQNDPYALALLRHYRTMMALAQEARKPIFQLTAADGAQGAHWRAARSVEEDFRRLAAKIAEATGFPLPVKA